MYKYLTSAFLSHIKPHCLPLKHSSAFRQIQLRVKLISEGLNLLQNRKVSLLNHRF